MKKEIRQLGEKANKIEVKLYNMVCDFENHMNECDCDDAVKYDFVNIIGHFEVHTYCLNCGGYIEPNTESE